MSPLIRAGAVRQHALIVGDEMSASVNQSQRQIGLAAARMPSQQHSAKTLRGRERDRGGMDAQRLGHDRRQGHILRDARCAGSSG